jgi:hypothetical protein
MSKYRFLAAFACLCASIVPASASTVAFRTDAQLVAQSERVVHGRVVAQRATRGPQGRSIYTVTTVQIIEDLSGVDGTTVDVWELGGTVDGETMYVGGGVQFRLGEEVVVMLERGPQGMHTVGMGLSKFEIEAAVNGERQLRRNLRETNVVGGAVARDPFLSELRALTVRRTGREPRAGRAPLVGAVEQSAQQPYTLLGPFRWVQADTNQPVTWYMNNTAPSPLLSGNGVAEMQTALSAWTAPASASITLQYGGMTTQGDADGPFNGLAAASGVVTFEDPNNEITFPTLAIGGGWAGGFGGTVNGTTFAAFIRGYVIFENAAAFDAGGAPSFRQSLNFSRVLTHEIGHAIGMGHSDSTNANIMYPSCCAGATPVPPALGPDDLAGVTSIYPVSGAPACTYSINPTSLSAPASGAVGLVSVTTQAGCSWTASMNSPLVVNLTGATSGTGSGTVSYSVSANPQASTRSGALTIAGQTFTVTQAAACIYTLSTPTVSALSTSGTGTLSVTAGAGCGWTAVSNSAFINIVSGSSGSGSGSVNYSYTANGTNFRTGTITVAGQTVTFYQFGTGPFVSLSRISLRYGATRSGGVVTAQTTSQTLRLEQTGGANVSWTATSSQPWLLVSPTSGVGPATITVSANPAIVASPAQLGATISFTLSGAGNLAPMVNVGLATMTTGTSSVPTGVIDTPLNNATGVVGAIPVTGWAIDDVDVTNVFVCRYVAPGDVVAPDGRCGGASQIYLGDAVFIEDARSDVAAAYPVYPRSYRSGWGFMLLTNMLPGQGNGTYTLVAYAMDREGVVSPIGQRSFTADNAHATKPFGAIDTPGQGGTASSNNYVNFGWALTPMPKFIPHDGSTITVYVDGASVGNATYNNFRSDIASLFPGLNNTNAAIGFKVLDTTSLADGLHTIAWTVADNLGAVEGIGSRYFRVDNSSSLTAAPSVAAASLTATSLAAVPATGGVVYARMGWDESKPWRALAVNSAGKVLVRAEEIGRVELQLGVRGGAMEGYLRTGETLAPLPVGSRLDRETGTFTWQPGVGFVGSYDFVFVQRGAGGLVGRQDVRVILQAKGSGFVGPQVIIDTPSWQSDVAQPFVVAGWAVDPGAAEGTGISTLHAWAYPLAGGAPIFVGAATYGGARPDVAAVHGDQFRDSGYGLMIQGLTPGNYDLAVFAWVTDLGDFAPAKVVRVTIR